MSRRRAREVAMCLLYEREMNIDAQENTLREMCDVLKSDRLEEKNCAYIGDVLAVYDEKKEEIDSFISQYCVSWKIERLSRVDLSILRLAVIELYYLKKDSYKLCINEAVELAKKYSSEKSPRFVNGVLGAMVSQREPVREKACASAE